jgi:hypothetical protein
LAEAAAPQGAASDAPHRAVERTQAERALAALAQGWDDDAWRGRSASARELAIEFRRRLQTRPEVVGQRLRSDWIERHYAIFCRSLGLSWWPPFSEFAAELKDVMPRKRVEVRRGGKRVGTVTAYLIEDPAAGVVVDLETMKRAAAVAG